MPNNNGLYYDFSIPLDLYNLIQKVIFKNQSNPNTPQIPVQRAPREWFSQPAPYTQGAAPKVTVFICHGTHNVLDVAGQAVLAIPDNGATDATAQLLDLSCIDIVTIEWADAFFPFYNSVLEGKAQLVNAIQQLSTPFILFGLSQGATVISLVLEEIQSGILQSYQSQLIAGVTFGNTNRQAGKCAPIQTDPGGHGIWGNHLLASTPDLWWDFVLPHDIVATITDDPGYNLDAQAVFEFGILQFNGGDFLQFILNNLAQFPVDILANIDVFFELVATLVGAPVLGVSGVVDVGAHGEYAQLSPPGNTSGKTCSELAADYINATARAWQAAYVFMPPTEVLTINLKLPLSVGQLGFQILRVPCNVTAWYQDRNGNWIQLTDENYTPVSLNISYSASTTWYSFNTDIYPVVATAVQLRIKRVFDSQMGNKPYVVGIKELLVRRNVYDLHDTPQAIADQQDVLGNTITSYVKCWNPNNVLDNDPSTFWKSFPCPDPNGVVSLFLDVRDASGNPQLIDTIYIDPVYAGNTLNLYYSNDTTQGTLIINPCNLPPDTEINSTWTIGVGMEDTSGPDLAESQLLFPTAFGPMIQQPMWIGIEWTPNFTPDDGPADNPILFGVFPTVNTVQLVTLLGNPTAGSFTLTYEADITTDIAENATASTVQTALEALDLIGTDNVSVEGSAGGPWQITFIGALGGQNIVQLGATSELTGGISPSVEVDVTATGFTPAYLNENTYWPTVYYDVGAGEITLEFTNGTDTVDYHLALSPAFSSLLPLEIVVGWDYNPSRVFMSVTQGRDTSLGVHTTDPASSLPNLITFDGTAGYSNFCGLMTALVVKEDLWTNGYQAFQASSTIYANPSPVLPDSNGNYPSTSLDNAILAVDWTSQAMPIGGTDTSWFSNKVWTPVFSNYVSQKGNLFLPQKLFMSYLKMEFSNLTAEPYPVYDQGISITYDTYPVSVIQSSSLRSNTALKVASTLISLGADVVTSSIGSINWFNPQTIQNAVNANWGKTQQPLVVMTGPGTITTSIPNTTQSNINNSYRAESSSPWVYTRPLTSPSSLAGQYITTLANGAAIQTQQTQILSGPVVVSSGGTSSITNTTVGNPGSTAAQAIAENFTPVVTSSKSNVVGQMGQDWWLFPGLNLKLPAPIMKALTATQTIVAKAASNAAPRLRFSTTSVHRYNKATVQLDAAVAYFAGVAEVQPYVTTYIASNDPPSFSYTQYDPTTFTYANINQLSTGPLTTDGSPYVLENPNFEYPLELEPWTPTGSWVWSSTGGLGFSSGQAAASIVANGANHTLISEPVAVSPGDQILITAFVAYTGAVSTTGGEFSLSGVTYNGVTEVGTVSFAMPATTATHTVADKTALLALSATIGQSATITSATGGFQGTYTLINTPASTFSNWVLTGYGTLVNLPSGNIDGDLFIPLVGTYTVPGSGVNHLAVSLNVTSGVTGGTVYYSGVSMDPLAGVEGMVSLSAVTQSTFADMTVNVSDSGLMQSDSMWARLDPLDTNISELQLAPYVTTLPSTIPTGFWDDDFATWDSTSIDWGEPFSVVAITVDPNLIFNGNRALHFKRAAGAGEAGILITQQTNMAPQELAQLGCSFFKPTTNDNQIIVRLRRVSDGVYVHSETFTPVVGAWYTYLGQFFELPNNYDQVYEIEFVLTGDAADEIYLSNLFTNVAGVRYLLQLGDSDAFQFDVTPLVYADNANVSVTTPVNEFSLTVGIFNENCWAYGISLTPRYLK